MIETGIFGGTFNPIHLGHTAIANYLCEKAYVEEVWMLVSPLNPFKVESKAELLDTDTRMYLADIATAHNPKIHVSDFEFNLPRPTYTYRTMELLRKNFPDRKFVLIIGADNWQTFSRWKKPEEILRHHKIIIYPRPKYHIEPKRLPHNVLLLDTPLHNISSSQIRAKLRNHEDIGEYVHPGVAGFLMKKYGITEGEIKENP